LISRAAFSLLVVLISAAHFAITDLNFLYYSKDWEIQNPSPEFSAAFEWFELFMKVAPIASMRCAVSFLL
jgi:hypothetical protein